jgi:hypothetical protein
MLLSGRDPKLIERENKIEEQRKKLHEQRVYWIIERTKNPPSVSHELIATVHEDLTLKQMQKYFGFREKKALTLFWKNQGRFLEFIDISNPYEGFEKANPGYKYGHAWFLDKNPEYASQFRDMSLRELQEYREENWKIYNNLCVRMHEIAPKYNSLDAILIPIN